MSYRTSVELKGPHGRPGQICFRQVAGTSALMSVDNHKVVCIVSVHAVASVCLQVLTLFCPQIFMLANLANYKTIKSYTCVPLKLICSRFLGSSLTN